MKFHGLLMITTALLIINKQVVQKSTLVEGISKYFKRDRAYYSQENPLTGDQYLLSFCSTWKWEHLSVHRSALFSWSLKTQLFWGCNLSCLLWVCLHYSYFAISSWALSSFNHLFFNNNKEKYTISHFDIVEHQPCQILSSPGTVHLLYCEK